MPDAIASESSQQAEPKGLLIDKSHKALESFWDDLKYLETGKVIIERDPPYGESFHLNSLLGASNSREKGGFNAYFTRNGNSYHLNISKVVVAHMPDQHNDIDEETFDIKPKELKYERSEERLVDGRLVNTKVEKLEVKDSFIGKKGTPDQAKLIHERLLTALAHIKAKARDRRGLPR